MVKIHKYSGAGNTFVVLDGRTEDVSEFRTPDRIKALCAQYGTDGLMILSNSPVEPGLSPVMPDQIGHLPLDFSMEFFNPDGTGGMMCGNGGRCIVAFADSLGIRPASGSEYRFLAPDGPHVAEILAREGGRLTVRLKMIDVHEFYPVLDGWFVNTGTRHFVKFVPDADAVDVDTEGRRLRWDEAFAPVGANVNFVSFDPDGALRVRTFEKGVEGETLACGTGITASSIAAYLFLREKENSFLGPENALETIFPLSPPSLQIASFPAPSGDPVYFEIQARQDRLSVEFTPGPDSFIDVYLTGPAEEL